MGKSSINGQFSMAMLVITRGYKLVGFFSSATIDDRAEKSGSDVFSKSPFDDVKMRISYDRHSHVGGHV